MSKESKEVLGGLIEKAVVSAAREAAGEKLPGHTKALNEMLDEVTAQQQKLNLKIYRKGTGVYSGQEEFITTMLNMDPDMIRDGGIEPMIQQNFGGGNYRVLVTAPGVPARSLSAIIAGEPISVNQGNTLKALTGGLPGLSGLPGQPQPVLGPTGAVIGYNFGSVPSLGQQGLAQTHLSEAMVLASFLTQQKQPQGDSDELKAMRVQIEELKLQKTAAEAERARIESERRADTQIAELKAQMEKLSAPKESPMTTALAAFGAAAPVIVGYLQSQREAAALAAQAQRDAQQSQTNMMLALFNSQNGASKENLDLIKTMMLQPRETETDKMRGIMDIATSSMSTTMGLTQAMVNQMQAMQPGERPPWMEVIMTLIENASSMGQAFLEARAQKISEGGDEQPQTVRIGPTQVVKQMPSAAAAAAAASGSAPADIQSAASAATAAAQETLGTPSAAPEGEPELDENGQPLPSIPLPDFTSGAFKLIFEKITEQDAEGHFTGDLHEAAFRIWKHASSGDKIALIWVQNPVDYSLDALDVLAQSGNILITAERIEEVATAMLDLFEHFRSGLGALEYIQKYALSISLPKRVVVVPLPKREEGEVDDVGTVEDAKAEAPTPLRPVPVPPAESEASPAREEAPAREAAPTPSFGSGPPVLKAEPSAATPSFGSAPSSGEPAPAAE